ncbi:proline/glycine betaine ABC transporter substrate-binding periplasmic protein [Acetobacter nitrogenifigens DSM 23921 = NBRC 105050]|uniref:Glycine/betaine ABC transporter substrate-binding protein n=1 Tax=Acetobacter nitrogenifigens DSM 23921 = NBRC 105050 TaxID=1120919 RepID=A0A511XAC5_9PROT|nr:glycine betaine ABC transporter substrate-binding protein [Acetobacter nitrogenifigens]GBQ91334.1 proline/glycine betaine ABC transporter substrate-binding periplasmic protein [Acetobacter nitrogenifigens DSM 23921 = NBRC 105050]GEN59917.1 glycine/betaine ABC transporter substrate-binding protein [Acetobacter nitrogenifigens DSM 23921 = NBRC 105050]
MSRAIRVGHIDLSFHDASAREVESVLERHGHRIERLAAPHEEMFKIFGRGEIDMLVSAWLPASHGAYFAPFEDDAIKVTILYTPYCIWGVPDYVPENAVGSIHDLLGPLAMGRMEKLIQGINPGAGISRFSHRIVEEYGLGAAGYHFETGTEDQCFGRFEAAVAEKRWVVIPLWHPQWLHHRHVIRALAEPKGLLGGTDRATLLVRKNARALVGEPALDELARLTLGNARVSALDDALRNMASGKVTRSADAGV